MRAGRIGLTLWIGLLAGCGPDYAESQVEVGRQNCRLMDTCGDLDVIGYTLEECTAAAEAQDYDEDKTCPDYVPRQMQACLDAWEEAVTEDQCEADLSDVCRVCG
jgi:hypothetical protein